MDAQAVATVLAILDDVGISVWLDGGWGVDALLEQQTREHRDLDLVVSDRDVSRLKQALAAAGFSPAKPGGSATNFVMAHADYGEVDIHAVEFDDRGYGSFALPDGRRWPFPPSAFTGRGRITGRQVNCLSAEAQVQCHGQGYAPTEIDLRDMEQLQQRLGVVLPLSLCRQGRNQ